MKIAQRILGLTQSALKSYGPSGLKRIFWDKEYSGDKWNFADHTVGDCVYSHLEKHAANGSILDLGCGSGNTPNELDANAYQSYLGVDISETCLKKASKRSQENGRVDKNKFVVRILSNTPQPNSSTNPLSRIHVPCSDGSNQIIVGPLFRVFEGWRGIYRENSNCGSQR